MVRVGVDMVRERAKEMGEENKKKKKGGKRRSRKGEVSLVMGKNKF